MLQMIYRVKILTHHSDEGVSIAVCKGYKHKEEGLHDYCSRCCNEVLTKIDSKLAVILQILNIIQRQGNISHEVTSILRRLCCMELYAQVCNMFDLSRELATIQSSIGTHYIYILTRK